MNLNKIVVLLFFIFTLLDFFSSIYLLGLGFIEQNLIYVFIGDYFWFLYWVISFGVLMLMYKAKRIYLLNIVSFSHLVCGINNLGLIL